MKDRTGGEIIPSGYLGESCTKDCAVIVVLIGEMTKSGA
jgi:hypothetical protein